MQPLVSAREFYQSGQPVSIVKENRKCLERHISRAANVILPDSDGDPSMTQETVRIVALVLLLIVVAIIFLRRKNKKKTEEDDF